MDNKFILTDGQKSVNLLNSSDPSVWSYFSNAPKSNNDELYAKVSAVFRAFNLKANTVGNMPFVLYKQAVKEGGKVKATGDEQVDDTAEAEEFDNSATWENKVGFLPNPSELLRLNTLSYMATNTIYNLRTSDIIGRKTKGLYHAVPTAFNPIVNAMGTNVDHIERQVGTQIERYKFPDDKMLVRMWRLDHTTELLPSKNTEMMAISNAAGVVFFADTWIRHFFERGGVPPTVIGMKGAINPVKTEEEEGKWYQFFRGIGERFSKMVRVFNAEALDVKQFGSSVTELKDNTVYNSALANIAMGTGMPLSLLMANSANYATAKEEKSTWYENDIIPLCNWIAYEYNRQVFNPIGLRLEFQPETLDPQQEDETERAQAMSAYMKVLNECPTEEVFLGMAAMMGLEIPDELRNALSAFYTDKQKKEEEMQAQIQAGGYTVGPDGKPIPAQAQKPEPKEDKKPKPPAKFVPTLDQSRELQRWQELAFRKLKRGDTMPIDWRNDTLPDVVYHAIAGGLQAATDEAGVKAAFDVAEYAIEEPIADGGIKELANALNRFVDASLGQKIPTT